MTLADVALMAAVLFVGLPFAWELFQDVIERWAVMLDDIVRWFR